MHKIGVFFIFYLISSFVFATNYYVSSSMGNDNNDGLTEKTAWKSLNYVNSKKFSAGDTIAFKRGDIWYGSLILVHKNGSSKNPIIFNSFGTGNKPILTNVVEKKFNWISEGGNIWRTSDINHSPQRLLMDGIERLDAPTDFINLLGQHVPDLIEWGYHNNHLYILSSDNPNKHKIEIPDAYYTLWVENSSNIIFDGIIFEGGHSSCGILNGCESITIRNCELGKYSNYGIKISASDNFFVPNNLIIENNIFDTHFTFDYSKIGKASGYSNLGTEDGIRAYAMTNSIIRNNITKNWGHANLSLSTESSEKINGLEISNNKIYGNLFTAPDIAYGGRFAVDGYSHHNEFFANTSDNISVRNQLNGFNNHFHHNVIKNVRSSPLKDYAAGQGLEMQGYFREVKGNIIENNLFINTENQGIGISGSNSGGVVQENIIRNNIIYNCGYGSKNYGFVIENQYSKYTNDNNTIENNLIYNTNTSITVKYYDLAMNVSTFNKQISYSNTISDNISEKPLFIDANTDFHLQTGSPGIDKGVTPKATMDFEGNPIPFNNTLPDIGLFEYQDKTTGQINLDAGKDVSICFGNSTTLTATGGSSYSWSNGAIGRSITVSPDKTTTYTVTVSDGTITASDNVIVTVTALPVADAGPNKTIIYGESTTITAGGGESYLWSTGERTQSITIQPTATTIFEVTVYKNGCESKDAIQVAVNEQPLGIPRPSSNPDTISTSDPTTPVVANAGNDLTICKGESITLMGDGGATYTWSNGANTQNITVSPTRTTTYTLTSNRGGTTSTDEVIVTVINCNLNNGVNNSVSSATNSNTTKTPDSENDEQILNKADFELTVYPNPTEGRINVQTTVPIYNFNLVLMNINGNVIYSDTMDAKEDGIEKELDLSRFAKGVYLLQLYNYDESFVKKIVII